MISKIEQLSKLEATKSNNSLRYNTNLPLSIEVIEKIGYNRYKLLLGKKIFVAKSLKELKPKEKYWGDLNQEKEGIVSLSNLIKKPQLLSIDELFLDEAEAILSFLKKNSNQMLKYREFLISLLYKEDTNRYRFLTLTYMLLALKEGIIHLPLIINNKKVLFQFKNNEEENSTIFYGGFENLGAIKGIISKKESEIYTIFEKSRYTIMKRVDNIKVFLKESINPIFNPINLLLDIKG